MDADKIQKVYFSITEVSEMTFLKKHVLRYWESEFDELCPEKNRAGNRIYKKEDIELILRLKHLLYEDKYTLEGARKKLRSGLSEKQDSEESSVRELQRQEVTRELKRELNAVLALLNEEPSKPQG